MANNEKTTLLRERILLNIQSQVQARYIDFPFEVPDGASKVGVSLTFPRKELWLCFSLHDPNRFRGNRMTWRSGPSRLVEADLWVAHAGASRGAVPGELPVGIWFARIEIVSLDDTAEFEVEAYCEFGKIDTVAKLNWPTAHIVRAEEGWYKGELHCHSQESDGKYSVEEVLAEAIRRKLDFIALSEHNTISQWYRLQALLDQPIAILHSCEITASTGHANLHGISNWIDVYVDAPDRSMSDAAHDTHEQGGLFCINHPMNTRVGWRSFDFDWDLADMMEVYAGLESANNNLSPVLWDHHLRVGRRITGVAGTDSHDPYSDMEGLGHLVTWVYACELSEAAILDGLKAGNVYLSKGPEMRFDASSGSTSVASIGETLAINSGLVAFNVQILHDEDLWVFLLKDGYPFKTVLVHCRFGEWQELEFLDKTDSPCYYRIELHAVKTVKELPRLVYRDFTTLMAMSNPIWVTLVMGK